MRLTHLVIMCSTPTLRNAQACYRSQLEILAKRRGIEELTFKSASLVLSAYTHIAAVKGKEERARVTHLLGLSFFVGSTHAASVA
jgi:hypothetical protein